MESQSTAGVLATCVLAVLATAAPGQVDAVEPPSEDGASTMLGAMPHPTRPTYHYGILGPVGRPGVYVTVHEDLSLTELVVAAGGRTRDAASLAQVIREGRGGLQLIHSANSTDRLMPGDVVVFERTARQFSPVDAEMVGVGFVGVAPEPVVVSLPMSLASLPQLMAALHQDPALINSVRVIRTLRTAPRINEGQLPTRLVEGDVVVFDPSTIDRTALAGAESFPPPVLIPERRQSALPEPVIQPYDSQNQAMNRPVEVDGQPLASDSLNTAAEPARGFEQSLLPPLTFPETDLSEESDELSSDSQAVPNDAAAREVVTASMIDSDSQSRQSSEQRSDNMSQQPTWDLARPRGLETMFTASRLEVPSRAAAEEAREQTDERLAEVPAPIDLPATPRLRGFGSRATTLGLTVLATALLCFAASLLWSRLDDSTGLARSVQPNDVDQLPLHAQASHRGALKGLIDNNLPFVEEPAILPDRADYHGEAVGRQRLRIDADHALTGPHFSGKARTNRDDHSVDAASGPANAKAASSSGKSQGLLDRVLVAMEREKRR